MPIWINVMEGESATTAKPVLATGDPRVVAAVVRTLVRMLGPEVAGLEGQRPARASALKLDRPNGDGP